MNINLKVPHAPGQRYLKILSVLSSLIKEGLTEKEMEIISHLNEQGGVLTTDVRKFICQQLDITPDYLGNYIKKLRKKKAIIKDDLNASLRVKPLPDDQQYFVTFIFETQEAI